MLNQNVMLIITVCAVIIGVLGITVGVSRLYRLFNKLFYLVSSQ